MAALREAACALVGAQSAAAWQLDLTTNEMWVEQGAPTELGPGLPEQACAAEAVHTLTLTLALTLTLIRYVPRRQCTP